MSMLSPRMEFDVARNLRTIEWLKSELLGSVSSLFKALVKNAEEAPMDAIANLVVTGYLLAKRLGISFATLDEKIRAKVAANIQRSHEIEKWYGDFTSFQAYLAETRKPLLAEEAESR